MQYLNLEYKIPHLEDKDIPKIEEYLLPFESEYFNTFKQLFPDINLEKYNIVLSDNIWRDIDFFYKENGFSYNKLRPKGLEHLGNIVSLNGITKYFWSSQYFNDAAIKMFFTLLIENIISNELEIKYSISREIPIDNGINLMSERLTKLWLGHLRSGHAANKITNYTNTDYESMEDLTFAFKRNIKIFHYKYQGDLDNYTFLLNSILELEIYIRRILSYKNEINLKGLEEFDKEINSIISKLEDPKFNLDSFHFNNYTDIKDNILSILRKCDIEMYESKNTKEIGFKISDGPKKLFPTLIDTHQRIICFIDILGFKALIEEYESINSSLVLKKLKSVFEQSRNFAFNQLVGIFSDEIKNEVEYKMFSDCIVISMPFIEYGIDLKSGFYSMAMILNFFQQSFMKEGFYLRGHVTIGSYYSDENILFSGGLVEAYQNESNTLYPVISVNSKLIDKLVKKTNQDDAIPTFNKLLISHTFSESKQNIILNPYFTLENYKDIDNQLNNIFGKSVSDLFKEYEIEFSFKKIFEEALAQQGINDIEKEFEKSKSDIFDKLIANYNIQLNIYQNLENDHSKRVAASRIIDKYSFLISLLDWLSDIEDIRFSFLELNNQSLI
jgi:hypothetical protein